MIRIKDIARSGHVKRWQIVRTAREQTLAEHSFMVVMLAQHIWRAITRIHVDTSSEELLLLQWALRHDIPEVLTGDIATPLKSSLRALVEYDPIKKIEFSLDCEYHALHIAIKGTAIEAIVKVADIMEGIVFLNVEGLGSHAELVKNKMIERFNRTISQCIKDFPQHEWHLCKNILDDLMDGPDGMFEFEEETK